MTFAEISLVKHLVKSAREIADEFAGALNTYEDFESVLWPDDTDLKKWQVTRKQFERCCAAAFAEFKRS
jgi:hypothetical protein